MHAHLQPRRLPGRADSRTDAPRPSCSAPAARRTLRVPLELGCLSRHSHGRRIREEYGAGTPALLHCTPAASGPRREALLRTRERGRGWGSLQSVAQEGKAWCWSQCRACGAWPARQVNAGLPTGPRGPGVCSLSHGHWLCHPAQAKGLPWGHSPALCPPHSHMKPGCPHAPSASSDPTASISWPGCWCLSDGDTQPAPCCPTASPSPWAGHGAGGPGPSPPCKTHPSHCSYHSPRSFAMSDSALRTMEYPQGPTSPLSANACLHRHTHCLHAHTACPGGLRTHRVLPWAPTACQACLAQDKTDSKHRLEGRDVVGSECRHFCTAGCRNWGVLAWGCVTPSQPSLAPQSPNQCQSPWPCSPSAQWHSRCGAAWGRRGCQSPKAATGPAGADTGDQWGDPAAHVAPTLPAPPSQRATLAPNSIARHSSHTPGTRSTYGACECPGHIHTGGTHYTHAWPITDTECAHTPSYEQPITHVQSTACALPYSQPSTVRNTCKHTQGGLRVVHTQDDKHTPGNTPMGNSPTQRARLPSAHPPRMRLHPARAHTCTSTRAHTLTHTRTPRPSATLSGSPVHVHTQTLARALCTHTHCTPQHTPAHPCTPAAHERSQAP